MLDLVFSFCRNSVVPLENIKAVPRHIGTRVALQPSLGTAHPVAGRTEHGPLEPHPLLFCAQEPNAVATHKASLAAEEPRCQALDWTSVRLWLVPSLASALALQQPVSPSAELGSGLGFCWLSWTFGHCFPFELSLIMRNVPL